MAFARLLWLRRIAGPGLHATVPNSKAAIAFGQRLAGKLLRGKLLQGPALKGKKAG